MDQYFLSTLVGLSVQLAALLVLVAAAILVPKPAKVPAVTGIALVIVSGLVGFALGRLISVLGSNQAPLIIALTNLVAGLLQITGLALLVLAPIRAMRVRASTGHSGPPAHPYPPQPPRW